MPDFILFQSQESSIDSDLKITVSLEEKIINKDDISYIKFDKSTRNFHILDRNSTGCYYGFLIDDDGNRIKNINEVNNFLKKK